MRVDAAQPAVSLVWLQPERQRASLTMTTPDPLREAEVYVAYGRTAQAIALLRQALQTEPGRADIQQRLEALERQAEEPRQRAWTMALAALLVLALMLAAFHG